jgi:UDP-N-acetylglucosamine--N-acetylmuramyl-(pentapeptide) pyrophosphoryl-undecaprenol N-acetylglucosamine transferase
MRIVLTGGGSGGHLTPLVAVAQDIREKDSQSKFLFLGPRGELEKKIIGGSQIKMKQVTSGKARRYFSFLTLVDIFKFPFGIIQSLWHLLWFMPDVVFSKGGYAAIPVVLVAWIYQIPILTHESDSVPGVANRIIGKFSQRIAISYPRAKRYFVESKLLLTGNPVRKEINQGDKSVILKKLGLTESKPVILVLGGSQGAQGINKAIAKSLPELLKRAQVIHQTGEGNYKAAIHQAREVGIKEGHGGYFPVPFIELEDMKNNYAVADVVISRAASTSISEIAANKKPAILIPLPTAANNHQSMNAYALAEVGGAVVLEESNLGEHMLLENLDKILNEEGFADKLVENIEGFYHVDAVDKITAGLKEIASV